MLGRQAGCEADGRTSATGPEAGRPGRMGPLGGACGGEQQARAVRQPISGSGSQLRGCCAFCCSFVVVDGSCGLLDCVSLSRLSCVEGVHALEPFKKCSPICKRTTRPNHHFDLRLK